MNSDHSVLDAFEQQLRDDMSAVVPPSSVQVGERDILAAVRRARTRRYVVAGLATAAVLAVLTTAVAIFPARGASGPQAAASLPPGSTVMSVPGPSRSTMAWTVGTEGGHPAVVFRLHGPDGWTTSPFPANTLALDDPTTATYAWPRVFDTSHVVGLLPDPDAQRTVLVRANGRWANTQAAIAPLPGAGRAVFAIELDPAVVLPNSVGIDGLVWFDHAGTPVDLTGRRGQEVSVSGAQVFVAAGGELWGAASTGLPVVISTSTSRGVLELAGARAGSTRTLVGLVEDASVPVGPVSAVLSDGSSVLTTTVALSDRRILSIEVHGPANLVAIRWTTADGTTRTVSLN